MTKWFSNIIKRKKKKKSKKIPNRSDMLLNIIMFFIALQSMSIIYPYIPKITIPIGSGYRIDHILTLVVLLVLLMYLARWFKKIIYVLLLLFVLILSISSSLGYYGFEDLYYNYTVMFYQLTEQHINTKYTNTYEINFKDKNIYAYAMDYENPKVRNFAVSHAIKNFQEHQFIGIDRKTLQFFSLFKEIRSRWKYVNDPEGQDYIAKASETLQHFSGDCDDYSVFMAACIKAIGGEVRLVRTHRHIYPEVKVGGIKQLENINLAIRVILFPNEVSGKRIYAHKTKDGDIWLNFDYTEKYPGGRFYHPEIVSVQNF